MIDMLAKVLFLCFLAAVVAKPALPEDDDENIPVYTEKVVPSKPTQAPRFASQASKVPRFGEKKIHSSPRKHLSAPLESKVPYGALKQTTSLPKGHLKTTKPIRPNKRPIRRIAKASGHGDYAPPGLRGDYAAPKASYAPLGVEYAPSPNYGSGLLGTEYAPQRAHAGNAPQRVYAPAPQRVYEPASDRIYAAPAEVKDSPPSGYSPNSYEDKPQPYIFGYELKDEHGSTQNRKEEGDDYGNKRGSYGYTDGYGIYRQVDYVADEHGFRASIKTNEPGTDNQDPADVQIHSEAEPAKY